jgi:hypothetical protein
MDGARQKRRMRKVEREERKSERTKTGDMKTGEIARMKKEGESAWREGQTR